MDEQILKDKIEVENMKTEKVEGLPDKDSDPAKKKNPRE